MRVFYFKYLLKDYSAKGLFCVDFVIIPILGLNRLYMQFNWVFKISIEMEYIIFLQLKDVVTNNFLSFCDFILFISFLFGVITLHYSFLQSSIHLFFYFLTMIFSFLEHSMEIDFLYFTDIFWYYLC